MAATPLHIRTATAVLALVLGGLAQAQTQTVVLSGVLGSKALLVVNGAREAVTVTIPTTVGAVRTTVAWLLALVALVTWPWLL